MTNEANFDLRVLMELIKKCQSLPKTSSFPPNFCQDNLLSPLNCILKLQKLNFLNLFLKNF